MTDEKPITITIEGKVFKCKPPGRDVQDHVYRVNKKSIRVKSLEERAALILDLQEWIVIELCVEPKYKIGDEIGLYEAKLGLQLVKLATEGMENFFQS